ncbi:class I SAM-dependent methyltransferase [Actinomadura atramentaria]|uniref:class I SAM-dependent methyltransferase n=1 Tax=Actinomadura atramentaria TaxID=1990 RepID=UPI000361CE57|nr:class I SAM-dependent methyltransferase [Actinomadura atramentaria]
MQDGVAGRLTPLLTRILLGDDGTPDELPVRVSAWDGSSVGPAGTPAFVIRHRRALRRLLWKPGEMGLVRAYVAGELDIEGDVFAALGAVQRVMRSGDEPIRLSGDDKREIVRTAVMLGAVGTEPRPPAEEFPAGGAPTDAAPLRAPAAFFAELFGPTLAHGSGQWDQAVDLDDAQHAALTCAADRLGLFPGARVLDLRAGWGAFARRAAAAGARVVALTRTPEQAEYVADQRLDGVDVRSGGIDSAGDGPYDAVVGLGGVESPDEAVPHLYRLLAPGGRLLLQQPTRRPGPHQVRRTFTTSYMFPEHGEPRTLAELVAAVEDSGLEIRGVTALREHHARTLRAWAARLQRHWTRCADLAGEGRARVWLLYLAASALACESGRVGVHEIAAIRRDRDGRAGTTLVEERAVQPR